MSEKRSSAPQTQLFGLLDSIPDEVLFAILRFLPSSAFHDVKQVSQRFYQIINDPVFIKVFIKSVTKQYFPHNQSTDFKKILETQWLKEEHRHLPELLFLLLIGNNSLLKEKIKLADLYFYDKDGVSLYDWIYRAGNQNLLNYIYKHLIVPHYQSQDGKIDTKQTDEAGYTLLHWAILCRQSLEQIKELNNLGFSLDAVSSYQVTALHVAAAAGDPEVVQYLLSHHEARVNAARAHDGATALFLAAQDGYTDVVKLLLTYDKHVKAIKRWLTYDQIDVNAVCTTDGATALFVAAQNGHAEVVKLLLAHAQTNVNAARTTDGSTALYMAAQNGHADVVKLLLAHSKTDVNATCIDNGATALHIAVQEDHAEIVNCLLANKASAASGMQEDIQILLALAEKNHRRSALTAWLETQFQDPLPDHIPGITPLDIAIIAGHTHIAQRLLEKANDFPQEKIMQALQIAQAMANQVIVEQLQKILQRNQSEQSAQPQVSLGTSGFFANASGRESSSSSTSCILS
ncbi:ankyrin repeat domain-containing protein [Legionella lansingensis]|nr:ankyrin repeat domain-containing protein [Legionella lansingensis]